jgi:Tfp pilus assembly PilM family ATPase
MVNETFASQNIKNFEGLTSILRSSLKEIKTLSIRRAGLSLPDGIFRVQTLEFDELPANNRDRDRLVRWRLEKGAAFDTANTLLRYQVLPRQDRGYSVLACVAKQEVMFQYEDLLTGLSFEPWVVVPSSFNALNFYAPYLAAKNIPGYALAWVAEDSYTTIIMQRGGPRFYRYREIKVGTPEDVAGRLIRELEDSIHFYLHMDRQQLPEVDHLYLSGEPALIASLSESLKNETTLKIETLVPSFVLAAGTDSDPTLAAAFGAGGAL